MRQAEAMVSLLTVAACAGGDRGGAGAGPTGERQPSRPSAETREPTSTATWTFAAAMPDEGYFPDRIFDEEQRVDDLVDTWYSKHLRAMGEPSLVSLSSRGPRDIEAYRFLWLPTWGHPVAVR